MNSVQRQRATLMGSLLLVFMLGAAILPDADERLIALCGSKAVADALVAVLGIVFLSVGIGVWISVLRHIKADPTLTETRRRFWRLIVTVTFVFGAVLYAAAQMRWTPSKADDYSN